MILKNNFILAYTKIKASNEGPPLQWAGGLGSKTMGPGEGKQFSGKYGPDAKPDRSIRDLILKREQSGELPCAVAFEIAKDHGVAPIEVGKNIDLLNFSLVKCQLGLFGYHPKKKIVKSLPTVAQDLKDAIREALVEGRLPCEKAWRIASRLKVSKMKVSGACEAMGIKIKPCQLGAF